MAERTGLADFNEVYNSVIKNFEWGYVNDPDDPGGETIDGISRRAHPDWNVWEMIDRLKKEGSDVELKIRSIPNFEEVKKNLYQEKYWKEIYGSLLTKAVGKELFEQSIHMGVVTAVKYFQSSINLLNRNQKLYPDIIEDGVMGDKTYEAYKSCLGYNSENILLNLMNGHQISHYINWMKNTKQREKFIGVFGRVTIKWN